MATNMPVELSGETASRQPNWLSGALARALSLPFPLGQCEAALYWELAWLSSRLTVLSAVEPASCYRPMGLEWSLDFYPSSLPSAALAPACDC
jgi:hypothetical protein